MKASERYSRILQSYRQTLSVESISLSTYCKRHHIYYRGLTKWMGKNRVTVKQLKDSLAPAITAGAGITCFPIPSEQQLYLLSFHGAGSETKRAKESTLSCIKGVTITFPDGVIVCMKEISRQALTDFIVSYNAH